MPDTVHKTLQEMPSNFSRNYEGIHPGIAREFLHDQEYVANSFRNIRQFIQSLDETFIK